MKTNSFFKVNHRSEPITYGKSKTIRGMAVDISEVLRNGTLGDVSKPMESKMIYGKRIPISDLTQFDTFKNQIRVFENITRKSNTAQDEPLNDTTQDGNTTEEGANDSA